MSRPPKPVAVLKNEKKSHRTKKELRTREEGEKSLITGERIKETNNVKNNIIAHAEFTRIVKLLQKIEKDDAIYQTVINRYCLIVAECDELEKRKSRLYIAIDLLEENFERALESFKEVENYDPEAELKYIRSFSREMGILTDQTMNIDRQLQTKRKMLLDMEKENVMTIASALRNIPKSEDTNKTNPLLQVLSGD